MWFAFKLVSLNHWKQRKWSRNNPPTVVICFQISIFEPLETTKRKNKTRTNMLWFAFKLVSLNHWKQPACIIAPATSVVICFQISIFEPLETTGAYLIRSEQRLWFAFKLVSLNHWKQHGVRRFATRRSCDLLSN